MDAQIFVYIGLSFKPLKFEVEWAMGG